MEISQAAYEIAWSILCESKGLTPDERRIGNGRLRSVIEGLVKTGQNDLEVIADTALGHIRQEEQIAGSDADTAGKRLSDPTVGGCRAEEQEFRTVPWERPRH
jgi:hypothetical protein